MQKLTKKELNSFLEMRPQYFDSRRENIWSHETEVVWLHDPQMFPFVREVKGYTSHRTPQKSTGEQTVVGYCKIPDNPKGPEHFRWYLAVLEEYEDYEDYPWIPEYEWLDPLTVAIGAQGRRTGRKLTPEQKTAFEKFLSERRGMIEQRRKVWRERQRRCRARQRKRRRV